MTLISKILSKMASFFYHLNEYFEQAKKNRLLCDALNYLDMNLYYPYIKDIL